MTIFFHIYIYLTENELNIKILFLLLFTNIIIIIMIMIIISRYFIKIFEYIKQVIFKSKNVKKLVPAIKT